jgi:N-acetyl-anhydromuramyl-L-alanine amidase AmpD
MAIVIHDLRSQQPNPPPLMNGKRKHELTKTSPKRVVERKPETIDGIVIHQTACTFKAQKGKQRFERALGIAAHAVAFHDGIGVIANPLPWLVWHGNGLNARSLGIEIEGNFRGLAADRKTVDTKNFKETQVTDLVVETARETLRRLVELGLQANMPIRFVWAHRQSSSTRRSDPGELIWKRVVVEYAVPKLKLVTEPTKVLSRKTERPGRAIPPQWDPAGTGKY